MQKDEEMKHRDLEDFGLGKQKKTWEVLPTHMEGEFASPQNIIEHVPNCWRAFYDANNGAIPIECQAGRAAMGMAAEETRLVRIEEGEDWAPIPGGWNELVDAAAMALDQLGKSHATNWANQMKKAAPVTRRGRPLGRAGSPLGGSVFPGAPRRDSAEPHLATLRAAQPAARDWPRGTATGVARGATGDSEQRMDPPNTEVAGRKELDFPEVLDKLARMQLADLQVSRDWVRQHLPQLGAQSAPRGMLI
eukprot:s1454_g9.t1